ARFLTVTQEGYIYNNQRRPLETSEKVNSLILDDAEHLSNKVDIDDHIRRIREALVDDPALAIGSTKELLETVMKTILGRTGAKIGGDMSDLWKDTRTVLRLDPGTADGAMPGDASLRRLLGSLNQIVSA